MPFTRDSGSRSELSARPGRAGRTRSQSKPPAVQAREEGRNGGPEDPGPCHQRALTPGTIVQDPDLHELAVAMPDTAPRIDATYGTDPGPRRADAGHRPAGRNPGATTGPATSLDATARRTGDSIRVTRHPVVVEAAGLAHATTGPGPSRPGRRPGSPRAAPPRTGRRPRCPPRRGASPRARHRPGRRVRHRPGRRARHRPGPRARHRPGPRARRGGPEEAGRLSPPPSRLVEPSAPAVEPARRAPAPTPSSRPSVPGAHADAGRAGGGQQPVAVTLAVLAEHGHGRVRHLRGPVNCRP